MLKIKPYYSGSTNIYETVVPFNFLLKFFGLAPFHLDLEKKKCGMRLQDYFVFLVSIVVYFIIFISALIDTITSLVNANTVLENGWAYEYILMIFLTILIVCYGFLKRRNIGTFLDLIYCFDESVDILNWRFKVSHSKDRTTLIFWISTTLLTTGAMCTYSIFSDTSSSCVVFRNIIYSCYITWTQILVSIQFIFSSCAVKMRYEILNKNMR